MNTSEEADAVLTPSGRWMDANYYCRVQNKANAADRLLLDFLQKNITFVIYTVIHCHESLLVITKRQKQMYYFWFIT